MINNDRMVSVNDINLNRLIPQMLSLLKSFQKGYMTWGLSLISERGHMLEVDWVAPKLRVIMGNYD